MEMIVVPMLYLHHLGAQRSYSSLSAGSKQVSIDGSERMRRVRVGVPLSADLESPRNLREVAAFVAKSESVVPVGELSWRMKCIFK